MSLDLALGIARSGLAAVQRGLAQASQNVANAGTAGYVRKTVEQQSLVVGAMPAGVRSGEAQRAVDLALLGRLDQSRGVAAAATLREALLAGIEQAHGATGAGATLGDAVAALVPAFTALRGAPSDAGQQRAALGAAGTVAERLNDVSAAIGAARQQVQDGIVAEVAAANVALRQIAGLTLQIRSGTGGDRAGLEDQRDRAIVTLSGSLELQAVRKPDGDLLVIARGGLVLPLDPGRDVLATAPATIASGAFHGGGGTLPGVTLNGLDVTGQIAGGRLGEYVAMRDRTVPRYQAETDLLAATLASRFDRLGLTLFTDQDGQHGARHQPALCRQRAGRLRRAHLARQRGRGRSQPAARRHPFGGAEPRRAGWLRPQPARRAGRLHRHARPGARFRPRRRGLQGQSLAADRRRRARAGRDARLAPPAGGPDRRLCQRRHHRPARRPRRGDRGEGPGDEPGARPDRPPRRRLGRRCRDGGDGDLAEHLRGQCQGDRHLAGHVGCAARRDALTGGSGMAGIDIIGQLNGDAAALRARLATLTRQQATGFRSQQPGDLGAQLPRSVSLRAEIVRRDTYGTQIG
jgi:flagellar hook-associated protein FlgK